MKIVDLPTFLAMPAGTIYAKYQPCIFGDIAIKDESWEKTWWYQELSTPWFAGREDSGAWMDTLTAIEKGEPSPPMDHLTTMRDGLYDAKQLFAVWERDDLEGLIGRLQQALADGYTDAAGVQTTETGGTDGPIRP